MTIARMKRYFPQQRFARFLFVGILNTVLTFAVYEGLLPFLGYRLAFTLSFIVGLLFTALLNIKVVFSAPLSAPATAAFAVYYCLYYLVNLGALALVIETIGVPSAIAPIITLSILLPINFVCSKYVIAKGAMWTRKLSRAENPRKTSD